MSRQVRNIHLYLPAVFSFFFIVDADDVLQQAALCLHAFYQKHPRVCNQKQEKKKRNLSAGLSCSELDGKTNKHQTSATQHKLYFIIKWLLIHVSCSYSCFDQSKIVTKTQLFLFFLLSVCSSFQIVMQRQQYCFLTATAVNLFKSMLHSISPMCCMISLITGRFFEL